MILLVQTAFVASLIANFIQMFGTVLTWAIIIRALLSWFSVGGGNAGFRLLIEITEPVLSPIRRALPGGGMIDFSPLIAIILIQVIQSVLVSQVGRLG